MSTPIRTLLVDDERLARVELRRLLAAHPEVQIVAEAANAEEARQAIEQHSPDLVFLDIQMPGASGLQLAEALADRCRVVFCTAFDSHALDAFGLNALDYLVKPVVPERLARTLARWPGRPLADRVAAPASAPAALPMDHALLLKFGERAHIVRLREIDRFDSVGNQAAVSTAHGVAFLSASLNRIEQRLDGRHFFRVNRGCILRLDAIASLEPDIGQGLLARLHNGQQVEVSRRAAQLLRARLGGLD